MDPKNHPIENFICGGKDHDFRKCPNRGGASSKRKGGKPFGIFMVEEMNAKEEWEQLACEMAVSLNPSLHALTRVLQPETEGYAVIHTGAAELTSSLNDVIRFSSI